MLPGAVEPLTVEQAVPLLAAAGLPTDDLFDDPALCLFGLREGGRWIAVVGMQPLDDDVLLRSLAVSGEARGRGVGAALVAAVEARAAGEGRRAVYLLTTGAAGFFSRLGYLAIERQTAPPALRAARQFAQLCPASAQLMYKQLP